MSLKGANLSKGSQQPRLTNKLFGNYTKLTQKVLLKPASHLFSNKKKPFETPQTKNVHKFSPSPLRSNNQCQSTISQFVPSESKYISYLTHL